jgi:hypothetical protein
MPRVRGGEFVSITIEPTVEAPAIARRFATESVGASLREADLEIVRLLVSEVVSNAVVHVGGWMHVSIDTTASAIRVEVTDGEGGDVPLRPTGFEDFGLRLLDGLAARWGTDPRGHGKAVWFEVPVPRR